MAQNNMPAWDEVDELVKEAVKNAVEPLEEEIRTQQARIEEQNERIEELEEENKILKDRLDGLSKTADKNQESIGELQGRELRKGAHLRWGTVERNTLDEFQERRPYLDVKEPRLERFTKDDGLTYVRLPGSDDPVSGGSSVHVGHEDLLPIQQLANLDDDMLANETLPIQLAVRVWRDRDKQRYLWKKGSKSVREFFNAGDLRTFIKRHETHISNEYAKTLVSRTISALLELSNNRLGVRKKNRRKDGLSYSERRIVLKGDVEIPGERRSLASSTSSPGGETATP